MNLLHKYHNNNYSVSIYDDGTKIREFNEEPKPFWPESIDYKVTDYCTGAPCYLHCHEMSSRAGRHSNCDFGLNLLSDLPAGAEIAIGGGNPLFWPDLERFAGSLGNRGIICNLTVNSYHFQAGLDKINDLRKSKSIYGLGISYSSKFIDAFRPVIDNNTIFHLIMGINSPEDIKELVKRYGRVKILILGYKQYGNGKAYYSSEIEDNIYNWFISIRELLDTEGLTVSFDNLAIKQSKLKRLFTKEKWDSFYMGDDGKFTFYIDGVKQEYAQSSTSAQRHKIKPDNNTKELFSNIRLLNNR